MRINGESDDADTADNSISTATLAIRITKTTTSYLNYQKELQPDQRMMGVWAHHGRSQEIWEGKKEKDTAAIADMDRKTKINNHESGLPDIQESPDWRHQIWAACQKGISRSTPEQHIKDASRPMASRPKQLGMVTRNNWEWLPEINWEWLP